MMNSLCNGYSISTILQQMVNTFNYSYIQAIISQINFHHLTTMSREMTDKPCITLLTRIIITSTIADVLFIIIFLEATCVNNNWIFFNYKLQIILF